MMKRILIAALAIVIVCVSLALGGCAESGLMENKSIIFHVYNGSKSLICDNGKNLDYIMIDDYSEYIEFANSATRWMKTTNEDGGETVPQYAREEISGALDDYSRQFFADNSLIVIEYINHWQMVFDISVEEICLGSEVAEISLYIDAQGVVGSNNRAFLFVPVSKTDAEAMENIRLIENRAPAKDFAAKPIIYLYPETELNVDVTLGYKDKITVSYPEYVDGWSVLARPDGKLVYNETGRKLYSLYYESENAVRFKIEKDGFVVKGEDVADFLEEKLAILGLNEYETEEFIIYWLPILQANEFNYIRFATADEIERNMPLQISGNPDAIIRVLMTYKGISEPIEVEEQELTTPERTGFVAVEWGGSEIN